MRRAVCLSGGSLIAATLVWSLWAGEPPEVPRGKHGDATAEYQMQELDKLLPKTDVTKAPPGGTVELVVNSVLAGTATADSTGTATFALTAEARGGKTEADAYVRDLVALLPAPSQAHVRPQATVTACNDLRPERPMVLAEV